MFHTPDYYYNVSLKLSETLDDIGVNERLVMKRRRAALLHEAMDTMTQRLTGEQSRTGIHVYILGSQSEGSTTIGLRSDIDKLICLDNSNVIREWSEWIPGVGNFLMIPDETPTGYCRLQVLRPDVPLPATEEKTSYLARDTQGRILLKNTVLESLRPEDAQRQGPSLFYQGDQDAIDIDYVPALPGKSWPNVARKWIDNQEPGGWPTLDMKRYAVRNGFFVVGIGSKISDSEEFEWRVSTSMAERCLMLNLNITQIRCYILMKMIIKTYINSQDENLISSFMCKTVMFHCIKYTHSSIWKECNILSCLTYCLLTLQRCVLAGNCPHFIICENNLMAGKFSLEIKHHLLVILSAVIKSNGFALLGIQIDNIGHRLQLKLNIIRQLEYRMASAAYNNLHIAVELFVELALKVKTFHCSCLLEITHTSLEIGVQELLKVLLGLIRYYREGDILEKKACRLMAPLLCTTLGSLIASYNIQNGTVVSPLVFALMSAGLDSDVGSSRFKLAAVYYCTGDLERTELILKDIEQQYDSRFVANVCNCYSLQKSFKEGFCIFLNHCDEEVMRHAVAFCVRFLPSELNCVPHELQFEMFRSTQDERRHRTECDSWMDWAVVDTLPFLYFLKYKTYGYLQRFDDQQHALNNLVHVTACKRTKHISHLETALNLLGQCLEQEHKPDEALHCYVLSVNLRPRNNVARIHICRLLANAVHA